LPYSALCLLLPQTIPVAAVALFAGGKLGSASAAAQTGTQFAGGFATWPETTLCWRLQKALTTSRFVWKVNTHFTMLAPQLIPSALTSSVSSILQFPSEAVRPVPFLRHMTTQLLQEAAQVIPNQQTLINVVSKRVRQLGLGHRPLVETTPRMSLTDIALKEIITGKLTYESLEGSADGA
jgi:DNA-directed RNA polymerase subunit omega